MDSNIDNGLKVAEELQIFQRKLATLKENGTILSIEDLAMELFSQTLEEASKKLGIRDDPSEKQTTHATQLLKIYLILSNEECRRVVELRSRGWHDNREEGDAHFRRQRKRADSTTPEEERAFYKMMQQIGQEMHGSHHIFTISSPKDNQVNILDLCMAPGGYTAAALDHCNGCKAYGITLATEAGGHTVIIGKSRLQGLRFHDITMYTEFCPSDKDIPEDFKSRFSDIKPFKHIKFHLVFADGKTLRTHDRIKDTYDANLNKETVRLQTSQLILAMNRMHKGGTLVMLLHKIDTWHSASLLYTFSKFAKVEVFKPSRKHATRSSFYMIAKDIEVSHPEAIKAIEEWQKDWYRASFGGLDMTGLPKEEPTNEVVQDLLTKFGPRLTDLGQKAWMIQADALSHTSYAGSIDVGVKLGFRKRVWNGLKGVFKDHHEGLKMVRGVGYAPIGGRGAGGWVVGSDGHITAGTRGSGREAASSGITGMNGDNRAFFMVGA
ncbi:hypothetical protein SBOR_9788 [Sclerotinia borealis F-4128]|uniref:Ribosomal RNA methyltransferase FtsJ domain-containing protein n=1 Tax=Sclerotinia borealis (strain F-4128) TaxID=1432307 RepID=W9C5L5_SCLBF|nr:hypothetical protein SBOR_9788 [Sclerotinia borealis F-4128]